MQIAEDRPPYITFEVVAEEDRAASIEKGHYVAKDVVYAIVTPQGSKDRIPRQVDDWFANLREQVRQGRFPQEWLRNFQEQYNAWKSGREIPLHGSPVANWPAASPAQVRALQAANLLTVEDLAAANEEALHRLGMGGRALKQRAVEWLAAAAGTGKIAEEVAALKQQNADLLAAHERLMAQNAELVKRLEATAQPAEGAPEGRQTPATSRRL